LDKRQDVGGVDGYGGLPRLSEAYRAFEALAAGQHTRGVLERTVLDLVK